MPKLAPGAASRRIRRSAGLTGPPATELVSVAGLLGRPVRNQAEAEVGRVVDVVVRWQGESYPPVTGLVVRVGRRQTWMPAGHIAEISGRLVTLRSARLDLRDFEPRAGEVTLNRDVIDHQMVDVDDVKVFRAADLYLARVGPGYVLVGADVGMGTLLRRLGPARWRATPTPDRVIDWATIQPFGDAGGPVRVAQPHQDLARLRPGELADLLEDLGRREREELLGALDKEQAADALEEMESDDLRNLLRELSPQQTARLVADMEPDEAAEALRDLDSTTRDALLADMAADKAAELRGLLQYSDRSAGGLMTTNIVCVATDTTVAEIRRRLRADDDPCDIDGVAVVDDGGLLVDDLHLIRLFLAEPDALVGDLATDEPPSTVTTDASIEDVTNALVENRSPSLLVTDPDGRPVGRILADDLIDSLVPARTRIRFPRLLS